MGDIPAAERLTTARTQLLGYAQRMKAEDKASRLRQISQDLEILSMLTPTRKDVISDNAEILTDHKIELSELGAGVPPEAVEAAAMKRRQEAYEAKERELLRRVQNSGGKPGENVQGSTAAGPKVTPINAPSGECPRDLSGIEAKLPDYDDAQLDALRGQMLSFDTRAHFDNLISQGVSPQAIAGAAAQQAAEAEKAMPSVNETIREISDSPERVFSQLRDGTFAMSDGTLGQAGRAWALANYMVIANRETAVALACMAR